jgi:hypothetical protein
VRPVLLLLSSAALCLAQLQGIVDIHVHSDPDGVTRKLDALDTARLAKEAGVRAIVLKNHWAPTAQLAYTVAKVVPGIEVLGGIALNRAVGGVNPEAVKQGAAFTGGKLRIVWMPTFDAENYVRFSKQDLPFAAVSRDGKLLPETIEVLQLIAKNKLVLATGHSSAAEDLMLVREGRKQGIAQIVVTHPMDAPIHMSLAEMQEAARLGAYVELCGNAVLPTHPKDRQSPGGGVCEDHPRGRPRTHHPFRRLRADDSPAVPGGVETVSRHPEQGRHWQRRDRSDGKEESGDFARAEIARPSNLTAG